MRSQVKVRGRNNKNGIFLAPSRYTCNFFYRIPLMLLLGAVNTRPESRQMKACYFAYKRALSSVMRAGVEVNEQKLAKEGAGERGSCIRPAATHAASIASSQLPHISLPPGTICGRKK